MKRASRTKGIIALIIIALCLISIVSICGCSNWNGAVTAVATHSSNANQTYYRLNITGLESDKYFIGYADITITSSDDTTVFNGYVLNVTLMVAHADSFKHDFNLTVDYNFTFGKANENESFARTGYPANITLAEWSLPAGVYRVSGEVYRGFDEVVEGHKKGDLIYEKTINLQSDTNLSLYFKFEPWDKIYSEAELSAVESITTNTPLFLILFIFLIVFGIWYGKVLQRKGKEHSAFICTYMPFFILFSVFIYFIKFFYDVSISVTLRVVIKDLGRFMIVISIFTWASSFGYAVLSYRRHSYYRRRNMKFMSGLALALSIILSLGVLAIPAIVYLGGLSFMCYAMMYHPLASPLKPKILALLGVFSNRKLLEKLWEDNNINMTTYEKIKRNL